MAIDDTQRRRFEHLAELGAKQSRSAPQITLALVKASAEGETRDRVERVRARDERDRRAAADEATRGAATPVSPSVAATAPRGRLGEQIPALALGILGPIAAFPFVRSTGYFLELPAATLVAGAVSLLGALAMLRLERPGRGRPPWPAGLDLAFAAWTAVALFYTGRRAFVEENVDSPAPVVIGALLLLVAVLGWLLAFARGRRSGPAGRAERAELQQAQSRDLAHWSRLEDLDEQLRRELRAIFGGLPVAELAALRERLDGGAELLVARGLLEEEELAFELSSIDSRPHPPHA